MFSLSYFNKKSTENPYTLGLPTELVRDIFHQLPRTQLAELTRLNKALGPIAKKALDEKTEVMGRQLTPEEREEYLTNERMRWLNGVPPEKKHYIKVAMGEEPDEIEHGLIIDFKKTPRVNDSIWGPPPTREDLELHKYQLMGKMKSQIAELGKCQNLLAAQQKQKEIEETSNKLVENQFTITENYTDPVVGVVATVAFLAFGLLTYALCNYLNDWYPPVG